MADLRQVRHGSTSVVTIDRPEALNSLSTDLLSNLPEALRSAGERPLR